MKLPSTAFAAYSPPISPQVQPLITSWVSVRRSRSTPPVSSPSASASPLPQMSNLLQTKEFQLSEEAVNTGQSPQPMIESLPSTLPQLVSINGKIDSLGLDELMAMDDEIESGNTFNLWDAFSESTVQQLLAEAGIDDDTTMLEKGLSIESMDIARKLHLRRHKLTPFDPNTGDIYTATAESVGLMTDAAYKSMCNSLTMDQVAHVAALRIHGASVVKSILDSVPSVPLVSSVEDVAEMTDVFLIEMPTEHFTTMISELSEKHRAEAKELRRKAKNRRSAKRTMDKRLQHTRGCHHDIKILYNALVMTTRQLLALDPTTTLPYNPKAVTLSVNTLLTDKFTKDPVEKTGRTHEVMKRKRTKSCNDDKTSTLFKTHKATR